MRPFDTLAGVWPTLKELEEESKCAVTVVIGIQGDKTILQDAFPGASFVPRGIGDAVPDFPELDKPDFLELSRMMATPDFKHLKWAVLNMLNRHDPTGAFRLVDREVFFYKLFFGLGGLILREKVTHLFFDITPHVATEYVAFWIGKSLGLQVIFLQPVPVAGISLARTDVNQPVYESPKGSGGEGADLFQEMVRSQVELFSENLRGGNPVWVSRYLAPELKKIDRRVFRPFAKLQRFLALPDSDNAAGMTGVTTLPTRVSRLLESVLIWSHRKSFLATRKEISLTRLPEVPFLLYAMTHEPERTFFPEALPWDSQFEFIARLAAELRGKKKILVKEHETQYVPGRLGYASRSSLFYSALEQLPGVEFVSSRLSAQDILKKSDGVISATGTICVEAALLGKPSYYFGSPWWNGFPGTTRISESDFQAGHLPDTAAYSEEGFREWTAQLVSCSVTSTCNVTNEIFSTKYAPIPAGYRELEVSSLKLLLHSFLSEPQTARK